MNKIETALRRSAAELPDAAPADLDRQLAERAAGEGLLDVAYASADSPVGPLLVATTPRGLVRVAYTGERSEADVLDQLARKLSPRVLEAPARLDDVRAAARGSDNLLPPMKAALRANATLGEVSDALRDVFGVYRP